MSLVQAFPPLFEAAMLDVAVIVSRFEAETLRIRPSLRFFTVGAERDQLFRQAVIFSLAPLHAFALILLIDALQGRHQSSRGVTVCFDMGGGICSSALHLGWLSSS